MAQRVKSLPAMQETRVPSLDWEDPLEKEMATHSCILAWKIPWMRSLVGYSPRDRKESDTTERLHFRAKLILIRLRKVSMHTAIPEVTIHTHTHTHTHRNIARKSIDKLKVNTKIIQIIQKHAEKSEQRDKKLERTNSVNSKHSNYIKIGN